MIKHKLFVEQPNMELKKGTIVTKEMAFTYKNEQVDQVLNNLLLETMIEQEGNNGVNTYKSRSYIAINLNEGDILLFDTNRGYYLPKYPMTTVEEAVSDIDSLVDFVAKQEEVMNSDAEGDEKEGSRAD